MHRFNVKNVKGGVRCTGGHPPKSAPVKSQLLLGPHGVGRNELKKRLLASDNDRFATAVPRKKHITFFWEYIFLLGLLVSIPRNACANVVY